MNTTEAQRQTVTWSPGEPQQIRDAYDATLREQVTIPAPRTAS